MLDKRFLIAPCLMLLAACPGSLSFSYTPLEPAAPSGVNQSVVGATGGNAAASGTAGDPGPDASSAAAGATGSSGTAGAAGTTGVAGGSGGAGAGGSAVTTGAAGTTGTTGSTGTGSVPLSCSNAPAILQANCWSCHTSPPQTIYANLDLESSGVAARLVGVAAYTGASGACAGRGNLLDPGTLPATGILIEKINFSQTCGSGMPFAALAPLSQSDLDCLQAWANGLVASAGN
jgi:hypothetical protein